jgi:hypothetical protein
MRSTNPLLAKVIAETICFQFHVPPICKNLDSFSVIFKAHMYGMVYVVDARKRSSYFHFKYILPYWNMFVMFSNMQTYSARSGVPMVFQSKLQEFDG